MEILSFFFIDGLKDIIRILFIFSQFSLHFLTLFVQSIILGLEIAEHSEHLVFQYYMIFHRNFFLSWQININILNPSSFLEFNALNGLEEKGYAIIVCDIMNYSFLYPQIRYVLEICQYFISHVLKLKILSNLSQSF